MHPGYLTHRFAALVAAAGLPPIRLHVLRHGAAALAHMAGTDLKTISDQLGHSSIVLTADTYTSVLPAAQYKAAEATARLVLDAARHERNKIATVARRMRVTARRPEDNAFSRRRWTRDHRKSPPPAGHPTRSPTVATARQPLSIQNRINSYIRS